MNLCMIRDMESFWSEHWSDKDGNPGGGVTTGTGFTISWQNGPLGRGAERKRPNGAFVEHIINAAIDRLNYYQGSKFTCQENAEAIVHLEKAMAVLASRTKNREVRNVEGTHQR